MADGALTAATPAAGRSMAPQQRTALFSIAAALFLVGLKLVTGLLTGSLAMIAEAAHSGTDLVAAVLTFYALRVAIRPADREHPYGHGKAEHLAALAEGAFLLVVSAVIVYESISRLTGRSAAEVDATWWAFLVLGVVLIVDVSRAVISARAAKEHSSAALAANALHFASDFAGTLAVIVGLLLVRAGYGSADAWAALFVAALVVVAAVRLMRQNVQVLMDQAPQEAAEIARAAIAAVEPRAEVRRLRVREAGGRAFVDAVIGVAPDAAVGQGHAVADNVERAIQGALPRSDVTVHIEQRESADLRERATGAALSVRRVREVRVHREPRGNVAFMTIELPGGDTLATAHEVAARIEARAEGTLADVAEVVVHTEPVRDR